MWASFLLPLQNALPHREFRVASSITRDLRMRKDAAEIEALRAVSESADRAYARILERPFTGRTEREIGADLADLLRAEGHDEVAFTIVGSAGKASAIQAAASPEPVPATQVPAGPPQPARTIRAASAASLFRPPHTTCVRQ